MRIFINKKYSGSKNKLISESEKSETEDSEKSNMSWETRDKAFHAKYFSNDHEET